MLRILWTKCVNKNFFNKNYKGTDTRNFGENIEESGYVNLKTVNDLTFE